MKNYCFCGKPIIIDHDHAWTIASDGRKGNCLGYVHTLEDGSKYLVGAENKGFLICVDDYKYVLDFNEWDKTENKQEVYCITDNNGNQLFDVFEDDFSKMYNNGLVNGEGDYYLLGNPTKEDIKKYQKMYGIKWY